MMDAIDTSLLYAAFNVKDQWHAEGRKALAAEGPIIVPPGVLQETLDLLGRRHGTDVQAEALRWLAGQPRIIIEASRSSESHAAAVRSAVTKHARYGKLSFADLWCVAHAHEHKATLRTKDKTQAKAFAEWT